MSAPISAAECAALLGRWAAERGPLYLLLAARLRALIDEGALRPDTRLPAERRLAQALSVGRGTVVAAYAKLREEGRVTRRQGSGTRIASPSVPGAAAAATGDGPHFLSMFEPAPGDHSIVLTCAAPDAPPAELVACYQRAVADLAGLRDDIGYAPAGVPALRTALAEYYTRRGLPTERAEILVTSGAHQAIDLVLRAYTTPGEPVLCEQPTYPGAVALLGAAGVRVHTVSVGTAGVDPGELTTSMRRLRPTLTYLVPSFHNPTGTLVPATHRRRVAATAGAEGLLVVDDETLVELGFHGESPTPLAAFPGGEGIITVGSLSKLAWGGLRVGWVRAPREVIARLSRLKALSDLGNDMTSQFAAVRLLDDPQGLVRRRRADLAARCARLTTELGRILPEWQWVEPAGGQTLWARLPAGNAASFAQLAQRHGVALLPGDALAPGSGLSQHLRIPFLAEAETLTEAVRRIRLAWDAYSIAAERPAPAPSPMVV